MFQFEPRLSCDKLGNSLDDEWIHTKIASKLIADANTPAQKIDIGVVTLRAAGTPEAKAEASPRVLQWAPMESRRSTIF
jgi:hypothetical protein